MNLRIDLYGPEFSFKILDAVSLFAALQASKRKRPSPFVARKENGVINGRGDFIFIFCQAVVYKFINAVIF